MTRRSPARFLLPAAAFLLVGSCCVTRWHLGARHAVRTENVAGITAGMSRPDVEALLGRPADAYIPVRRTLGKGETMENEGESFAGPSEVRLTVGDWQTAGGPYVRVAFDGEGKAMSKRVEPNHGVGFVRRARGWLLGF